jgi:LacI family transcriptional regulator
MISNTARATRSRSAAARGHEARVPRGRRRSPPVVAVALGGPGSLHWHDVERGFAVAASERGWRVSCDVDGMSESRLARLRGLDCDGLVADITTVAEMREAKKLCVPVVNVSEAAAADCLPRVTFDNPAIGRLAADHLATQGYREFACYGLAGANYAAKRRLAFVTAVEALGFRCTVVETDADAFGVRATERDRALDRWLLGLPCHTGIFAVSDARAVVLLDACRRLGIDVPGRLGILGVGDCRDLCESSVPSLSSVRRNGVEVGAAAARLLEALLAGVQPPGEPVVIAPAGVCARESTAFGSDDAALAARAVTFMKDRIGERFGVELVARKLRVSRRTLERAFNDVFGESPHVRLLRIRAEAALAARAVRPDRSLTSLARDAGFSDVRHLRRTLKHVGIQWPG